MSADALEDNFQLDDDNSDYSLDIANDTEPTDPVKAAEENQKGGAKKRKVRDSAKAEHPESTAELKKPKKPKKQKIKGSAISGKFSAPTGLSEQADLWNKFMEKAYSGITQLELEDIKLDLKHMYKCDCEPDRTSPTYLQDLIKTTLSAGKAKNKITFGAPQVLILSSSALRVLELIKLMRPLSKRQVAKLFSRHVKIAEHQQMLKKTPIDIAVGTPNRVLKLLQSGDLKLNRLRLVVIDCWQDDKMRVIIDMDDTRKDLFDIWRDSLLPASANPDYGFKLRLV